MVVNDFERSVLAIKVRLHLQIFDIDEVRQSRRGQLGEVGWKISKCLEGATSVALSAGLR